jgi:hypothetical protein
MRNNHLTGAKSSANVRFPLIAAGADFEAATPPKQLSKFILDYYPL